MAFLQCSEFALVSRYHSAVSLCFDLFPDIIKCSSYRRVDRHDSLEISLDKWRAARVNQMTKLEQQIFIFITCKSLCHALSVMEK
jgi:hypothetical protein